MSISSEKYRIGKVHIAVTNSTDAKNRIVEASLLGQGGYVCVSNMRTVVYANQHEDYWKVMENAFLCLPDGTPLVWCGRIWGAKNVARTCGPHLFRGVLQDNSLKLKHFFLGDTDETLAALTNKCVNEYHTHVVGSYSPPFKPLEEYNLKDIADMINTSGADIVWTSLRAPKQDFLNSMLMPYLKDNIIVIGVGAAFRFELGEYKAPDGILQKMGLAGIRVKRDGSNFWTELCWYIKHTFYLSVYIISIILKRLAGKKYYE